MQVKQKLTPQRENKDMIVASLKAAFKILSTELNGVIASAQQKQVLCRITLAMSDGYK